MSEQKWADTVGQMLRARATRELIVRNQLERADNICIQTDANAIWKANVENYGTDSAEIVFYRRSELTKWEWEKAEPSESIKERLFDFVSKRI